MNAAPLAFKICILHINNSAEMFESYGMPIICWNSHKSLKPTGVEWRDFKSTNMSLTGFKYEFLDSDFSNKTWIEVSSNLMIFNGTLWNSSYYSWNFISIRLYVWQEKKILKWSKNISAHIQKDRQWTTFNYHRSQTLSRNNTSVRY